MLKIVTVGVPVGIIASAALAGLAYHFVSNSTELVRSDMVRALSGNIVAQRKVARCYETGCIYAPQDLVYGCAWRKIILQEQREKPLTADVVAEAKTCKSVNAAQFQFVKRAMKAIHNVLDSNSHPHL